MHNMFFFLARQTNSEQNMAHNYVSSCAVLHRNHTLTGLSSSRSLNSRLFHVSSHSTVSWAQLIRWQRADSDRTDSALSGKKWRFSVCTWFKFQVCCMSALGVSNYGRKLTKQLTTRRKLTGLGFFFFSIGANLRDKIGLSIQKGIKMVLVIF